MTDGLVTIITTLYESGDYIAKTIESVRAQTYTEWELVITDDCSTDNGPAIVESVFNFLKGKHRKFVFFRPDKEEYQRYVAGSSAIIIRILVSEAPLQNVGNILIPTIEKMLVDIAGDVEFDFLQGAEISYFYRNVLDRHKINKRKLIRYATRRGRSEQVKQLYNNAL
jgi:glycosyltransferase involved in cell wall biosynthesis